MSTIKAQTLKGFRDFLPAEARKRQYVINILKQVFESFGFEPLETPALEYEEVLLGKYGNEGDKLIYRFNDNGGRKVALRYDQTVPLARLVAQYGNRLPIPFKRYQIQPVWRAENTQKGRFREFLQCDIDTVGSPSPLSDTEIISVAASAFEKLGIKFQIVINDRKLFEGLPKKAIIVIDKLKKIGEEGVIKELVGKEICKNTTDAKKLLQLIITKKKTERLEEIFKQLKNLGLKNIVYSPVLARGLDYYTGIIFEVECPDYSAGSLGGGGRFDNLIGTFAGRQIPAVGVAFGFDRIIEAMDQLDLFPKDLQTTKVLVTIFSPDLANKSLGVSSLLRLKNINTESWLDPQVKLEKQLKYADQKDIPYVVIIGPEEVKSGKVILKDLKKRTQVSVSLDELTIN